MSDVVKMVELRAPRYLKRDGDVVADEKFSVSGFTCNCCGGNGWHWGVNGESGERVKAPCPMCKGIGYLRATVVVKWSALGDYDRENSTL